MYHQSEIYKEIEELIINILILLYFYFLFFYFFFQSKTGVFNYFIEYYIKNNW